MEPGPITRASSPRARLAAATLCVAGAALTSPGSAWAGSARDYLNAPIDSWLGFYNAGYSASVTRARRKLAHPHQRGFAIARSDADLGFRGPHGGRVDRAALPLRGIDLWLEQRHGPRGFRRWLPFSHEHLRRIRAEPRGVRQFRAANLLELSPLHENAASEISVTPRTDTIDTNGNDRIDSQHPIHTVPGIDVALQL